jgi:hypothetical protein
MLLMKTYRLDELSVGFLQETYQLPRYKAKAVYRKLEELSEVSGPELSDLDIIGAVLDSTRHARPR